MIADSYQFNFAPISVVAVGFCLASLPWSNACAESVDWSGAYIGLSAGYSKADSSHQYAHSPLNPSDACNNNSFGVRVCDPPVSAADPSNTANYREGYRNDDGVMGGGLKVGRNWNVRDFVLGIQAEAYLSDRMEATDFRVLGSFSDELAVRVSQRDIGNLRVMVGKPLGRFLPYLTAGLAFARMSGHILQDSKLDGREERPDRGLSDSSVSVGYVAGAGLHYAIDETWFVSAEYLYADYGNVDVRGPAANIESILFPTTTLSNSAASNSIRIGISRRF